MLTSSLTQLPQSHKNHQDCKMPTFIIHRSVLILRFYLNPICKLPFYCVGDTFRSPRNWNVAVFEGHYSVYHDLLFDGLADDIASTTPGLWHWAISALYVYINIPSFAFILKINFKKHTSKKINVLWGQTEMNCPGLYCISFLFRVVSPNWAHILYTSAHRQ